MGMQNTQNHNGHFTAILLKICFIFAPMGFLFPLAQDVMKVQNGASITVQNGAELASRAVCRWTMEAFQIMEPLA